MQHMVLVQHHCRIPTLCGMRLTNMPSPLNTPLAPHHHMPPSLLLLYAGGCVCVYIYDAFGNAQRRLPLLLLRGTFGAGPAGASNGREPGVTTNNETFRVRV